MINEPWEHDYVNVCFVWMNILSCGKQLHGVDISQQLGFKYTRITKQPGHLQLVHPGRTEKIWDGISQHRTPGNIIKIWTTSDYIYKNKYYQQSWLGDVVLLISFLELIHIWDSPVADLNFLVIHIGVTLNLDDVVNKIYTWGLYVVSMSLSNLSSFPPSQRWPYLTCRLEIEI